MSKGWDNIMLKKLKALTGKGLSTSEIGKRLGMSKNAIVGKLNRLGWNAKAGGAAAVAETKKEVAKKKEEPKTATKKVVAKESAKKSVNLKKAVVKKEPVASVKPKKTADSKTKKTDVVKVEKKSDAKTLAMHQRIVQHSLDMANLKPNQCRWPIGDPDSEHFHFCGETVFVGKPYCYEHCKQAYQFTPPKKK